MSEYEYRDDAGGYPESRDREESEMAVDEVGVRDYDGMSVDTRMHRMKSDWDELIGDDTL